jgi:hypothetical protein
MCSLTLIRHVFIFLQAYWLNSPSHPFLCCSCHLLLVAVLCPGQPPLPPHPHTMSTMATQWTVYRGVAYDLTSFIDRHPAGNWLIQLAIGRDCTALFESYHLRPEVAVGHLKRLPVLEGFPVDAVPRCVCIKAIVIASHVCRWCFGEQVLAQLYCRTARCPSTLGLAARCACSNMPSHLIRKKHTACKHSHLSPHKPS